MTATLFGTEDGTEPREALASEEQVQSLVAFGRREDVVRKWSYERAGVTLNDLKRKAELAVKRAQSKAKDIDARAGEAPPDHRRIPPWQRSGTAAFVGRVITGAESIVDAEAVVGEAAWSLEPAEAKRLLGVMRRVLDPVPPAAAADELADMLTGHPGERAAVVSGVQAAVLALDDEQVQRLAGYLVRVLKGER